MQRASSLAESGVSCLELILGAGQFSRPIIPPLCAHVAKGCEVCNACAYAPIREDMDVHTINNHASSHFGIAEEVEKLELKTEVEGDLKKQSKKKPGEAWVMGCSLVVPASDLPQRTTMNDAVMLDR